MIKGLGNTPADIAYVFENRKKVEQDVLTSHGEAGQYFVTFLDNHDQPQRFGYTGTPQQMDQIILGLGVLMTLPGIPCVYYGTEQGLSGHKTAEFSDDSMVREALWGKTDSTGKANGFDTTNPIYAALHTIGAVRGQRAALRYGRYYFRPISGDGVNFGLSTFQTGILAFSRILNDEEVVVVANTDASQTISVEVIVDSAINASSPTYSVLYSNRGRTGTACSPLILRGAASVVVHEVDGSISDGPLRTAFFGEFLGTGGVFELFSRSRLARRISSLGACASRHPLQNQLLDIGLQLRWISIKYARLNYFRLVGKPVDDS